MFNKKGQEASAAGAAVLLAVIAGLLVMFVILVSPEERVEILGEGKPVVAKVSSAGELSKAVMVRNILRESPGQIDYLSQREVEHLLPTVNIYTTTEAALIAEKPVAYAKRGVFNEEQDLFRFSLDDPANSENAVVAFTVRAIEGRLRLNFNGEEIFDDLVSEGNVLPIPLPKRLLREENQMEVSVSSPGLAFWATNEVSLENLKIVAEVTDTEAQSAKQTFLVSETEKKNLESVSLKFQPTCRYNEVRALQIWLNGEVIYDAIPDCDLTLIPLEIDPNKIQQGENELIFKTSAGAYLLSHLVVVSELKEVDFPTYYFSLSNEQFEEVKSGKQRVRLELNFVDPGSSKFGDVIVNGHVHHFDTREVQVVLNLSPDVVSGSNAVKIKPRKTVEIRQLDVSLVK